METTINLRKYQEMVSRPGKFEGESPETAYYYDIGLDGSADYTFFQDQSISVFEVTPEEKDVFNILTPYYAIEESDQGFVYGTPITQDKLDILIAEEESSEDSED